MIWGGHARTPHIEAVFRLKFVVSIESANKHQSNEKISAAALVFTLFRLFHILLMLGFPKKMLEKLLMLAFSSPLQYVNALACVYPVITRLAETLDEPIVF